MTDQAMQEARESCLAALAAARDALAAAHAATEKLGLAVRAPRDVIASGVFHASLGTRTREFIVTGHFENAYLTLRLSGEEVARIRYGFSEDALRAGVDFLTSGVAP